MSKKKRSSKKRLDSLLLILVLSAVLMVMSTYAWFTANKTVKIDSIDVKVTTSNGLQISSDGLDWKSVLTIDDLIKARTTYGAATNQLPSEMAPVSTVASVNAAGKLNMYYGNVYADLLSSPASDKYGEYVLDTMHAVTGPGGTVTQESGALTDTNTNTGYYAAFDVFLKSGSDATNLYASGSVKEVVHTVVDTKDVYTPIENVENETGIANAARVAFVKGMGGNGHTISQEKDVIQALNTVGGYCTIWEPNYDWHTVNGVANATALGWATGLNANASSTQVAYDGISGPITTANADLLKRSDSTTHADTFAAANIEMKSTKKGTPSMAFPAGANDGDVALTAGVTKYRIYLWVEGQDVDCENFAAGSFLEYNLSFSLDPYTAAP